MATVRITVILHTDLILNLHYFFTNLSLMKYSFNFLRCYLLNFFFIFAPQLTIILYLKNFFGHILLI